MLPRATLQHLDRDTVRNEVGSGVAYAESAVERCESHKSKLLSTSETARSSSRDAVGVTGSRTRPTDLDEVYETWRQLDVLVTSTNWSLAAVRPST